jgi:predicted transcriptional regulator
MSADLLAGTDKQIALDALQRMPETATLDEISEELAILAAIRRGEAAADAGRTLTHEEVKQARPGFRRPHPGL